MPKLTCPCGCTVELSDQLRQTMTELACPNCGTVRKLRKVPVSSEIIWLSDDAIIDDAPRYSRRRIVLVAVAFIITIPLAGWFVYANYFAEAARLYRAAVSQLRQRVHDGKFEVTNWSGSHFLWYANDETKAVRACSISFRSHPNGPLLGPRVTTWYFGITPDNRLVEALEDERYRALRFFDEDKLDSQSCIIPIPAHIKEKHPIVVEREKRQADQNAQADAIARMLGVGQVNAQPPAAKK